MCVCVSVCVCVCVCVCGRVCHGVKKSFVLGVSLGAFEVSALAVAFAQQRRMYALTRDWQRAMPLTTRNASARLWQCRKDAKKWWWMYTG